MMGYIIRNNVILYELDTHMHKFGNAKQIMYISTRDQELTDYQLKNMLNA